MKWHVVWNAHREELLRQAIAAASAPDEIIIAVEAIESSLERDPLDVGESREHDERIHFQGRYGVFFCRLPVDWRHLFRPLPERMNDDNPVLVLHAKEDTVSSLEMDSLVVLP